MCFASYARVAHPGPYTDVRPVIEESRRGGSGADGWWGCLHRPLPVNSCSFDCIFVLDASKWEPAGMKQPQNSQPQQCPSYHRTQALPARIGLLHHHHPCQQGHRHQAAHSQTEHHQHQRPAAPQAQYPMAQPQPPGPSYPFAVGAHEEAERAAAQFETASLERAELEHTRDLQSCLPNNPGLYDTPAPAMTTPTDHYSSNHY